MESWDYDPEIGGIDTVFGGSMRIGKSDDNPGVEIAFSPILQTDNGAVFLSEQNVEDYLNAIYKEAAKDGVITEDEILNLDADPSKIGFKVGENYVSGLIAGVDGSLDYDNNGNWAEFVGRTTADQYAQKVTGLASGGGMANPMSKGYSVENVGKFAQNNADPNDSKLSALNSGIKQIKDTYDSITKSLDDFMDKIKGDINVGDLDWGSLGGDLDSASDSAKDTSQEMNWLERAVKKVQNAYSRLKNVVSDTTRSWSTRNNALIQSQQELTRQINLQSQAYEYYMVSMESIYNEH